MDGSKTSPSVIMVCFVKVLAPSSVHSLENKKERKNAVNEIGLKKLNCRRAEDPTILRISFPGMPPKLVMTEKFCAAKT